MQRKKQKKQEVMVSLAEAAKIASYSEKWIRVYIRKGLIVGAKPPVTLYEAKNTGEKPRKHWLIPLSEVQRVFG